VAQRTANVAGKAIARFLGKSRETDATGDGAADFASRVGVTVARGFVRIPCFSGPAHEVKLTPGINLLTRRLNPRCSAALCLKPK
jgi:hypothetical protein